MVIHFCAKGSRKTGKAFIDETNVLADIVDCIEIDFNYPHDRDFESEVQYLQELNKTKNITFTVHAQFLNGCLNDFNESIRDLTLKEAYKNIDTASALDAKIVTIHPALEPYGLKLEKRRELEIDSYQRIADYAAEKGITIGLENEAQTCFWFPDRACKFSLIQETVELVNHPNFLYTLDIGHANVSGEDYLSAIKTLGNKIVHIHAHDNEGAAVENQKLYNRPDPHLPPGKGRIEWKKVLESLTAVGYRGYFELECEVKDMKSAIEYLKQTVARA